MQHLTGRAPQHHYHFDSSSPGSSSSRDNVRGRLHSSKDETGLATAATGDSKFADAG